jgi:hypothetical protein
VQANIEHAGRAVGRARCHRAHRGDRLHFGNEARREHDLIDATMNPSGVFRQLGRTIGRELNHNQVATAAALDQRPESRIARIATIPVRLAIDLHRLEQLRQAEASSTSTVTSGFEITRGSPVLTLVTVTYNAGAALLWIASMSTCAAIRSRNGLMPSGLDLVRRHAVARQEPRADRFTPASLRRPPNLAADVRNCRASNRHPEFAQLSACERG